MPWALMLSPLIYLSKAFILFPDPPSRHHLRRIASYASVVAPRRLASNTLLVIRTSLQPADFGLDI
jgi:tRNA G46 methylase TrmB